MLRVLHMSRSVAAYRGWERRRENDERVSVNIPPDLLPLWRRVKRSFVGSSHERFLAFMEYAEEHDREVTTALSDDADRALEALLAARGERRR